MAGTVAMTNNVPVWVVFNDVLLGLTGEGEATVTIETNWTEKRSHQTGASIIDAFFGGHNVTAQFSIGEAYTIANWIVAFSQAELQNDVTDNRVASNIIAQAETASQYIGQRATSIAAELKFIPVANFVNATTETNNDLVIPKAFCNNVGDIMFGLESDHALEVTMQGLFNPAAADGANLWVRGKTTGTWVAGTI